ncbi:MAG: glutamine synthetase III [Chitinophagales bacterium]
MTNIRFNSIANVLGREKVNVKGPQEKISQFFGSNVFNDDSMRKYLTEEAYLSVRASVESGHKIDRKIAEQVASSMKAWAMDKGATHFTHWFQPLTGATAEKHDTFFTSDPDGNGIESFNGAALVQQEPDASSFPNGGIRSTFEARGYTAWDPSSPAFIMQIGSGKTLCIPTIFVSYTGEALDYKAPLLKSKHALEEAAVKVCQYFDRNTTKVYPTLGWEQEYFLVDEALYFNRPDLVMTGRTIVGLAPAKGQQLDDHYFGSIPERIYAYMIDFETEAQKLGIPVKTRHNEVAPSQFEVAPTFEEVNLAVDHNQLLMDLMSRVADRHKFRLLLHEKPYAGLNGSGKHNNWSMATNKGKNLLSPGKTPKTNLQFLTFLVNTIKAVHVNADLLRAAIASPGNDHRLGANEAPPAIISVFIGAHLTKVLDEVENRVGDKQLDEQEKMELKLDIHKIIPDLLLDNTDRNRTSPFAFTGNKFEIRAVGSTANCASPMTVMNTIVAEQLTQFKNDVDKLIKKEGDKKDAAILKVLRRYISESRAILFEGDNYSKEWEKEAEKRGLSNVKTTPHALDFFMTDTSKAIFAKHGVFSEKELEARYEILQENYGTKIDIEASVLQDLAINHIVPAVVRYQNNLVENVNGLKTLGLDKKTYQAQLEIVSQISEHLNAVKSNCDKMVKEIDKAEKIDDARDFAIACSDKVKPYFDKIRTHVDALEGMVDDAVWPLPKYRELLFMR